MKDRKKSISFILSAVILFQILCLPSLSADAEEKAKITYENGYASADIAGVLIAADYENELLAKVSCFNVTAGEKVAVQLQSGDVLMLWESLESMRPIAEKYTVDKAINPTAIPTTEPTPEVTPTVKPIPTVSPTTEPTPTVKPDKIVFFSEDFEKKALGSVESTDMWKHDGGNVTSDIIKCTSDETNTSNAVKWYSNGTSSSRSKQFTILNSAPDVMDGEIFTFSADVRIGATNANNSTSQIIFGNSIDNSLLNIAVKDSISGATVNGETVALPAIKGDENGGRTLSKWFNVNISIDSTLTENNTKILLKPLNADDRFTVNGAEMSEYTVTTTSSVNAVTQIKVSACKGYFGAVIMDNIQLSKTVNPKSELTKAIELYGNIDTAKYQNDGIAEYNSALSKAKKVYSTENSSDEDIDSAKFELIKTANSLKLIENKDGARTFVNENLDWLFIKEGASSLTTDKITSLLPSQLDLAGWEAADLPHTWNAYDGSDGIKGYDRIKGWYRKNIYIAPQYEGKRIYLEFEGAALKTSLYVNGTAVPFASDDPYNMQEDITYTHRGGYEIFRFDITDYVCYDSMNLIAVCVDNTATIETIPLGGDYSKEGGLYRDVSLVVTEPVHIDMTDHGSNGLYLTPEKKTAVTDNTNTDFNLTVAAKIVNDSEQEQNIKVEAFLRKPDSFDVPDNKYIKEHLQFNPEDMYTPGGELVKTFTAVEETVAAGGNYDYSNTIEVLSPKLWDGIKSPYQYEVVLNVYRNGELCDTITDNVGFRYYYAPVPDGVNSGGGFYLNGRKYDLRGVGKHQDWGMKEEALGIAVTDKERVEDAASMYEMGVNAVRLVHYPHSVREIELYDKLGIVVWSELAMTSVICNNNAAGYPSFEAATLEQLEALIKQQYNNPSVFFWAFSNEVTHEYDDNLKEIAEQNGRFESAGALFEKMYAKAKSLDRVRLTTYALNKRRYNPDLKTDLTGMNLYPYWYLKDQSPKKVLESYYKGKSAEILDDNGNQKPLAWGEIGGSGIAGVTQEYNEDGTVEFLGTDTASETYQAYMHERILSGVENGTSSVWAMFVWQMFDSANDSSTDVLPGVNIKGLMSFDHKTKKDAYYFYKANWNNYEPFVHIVNTERTQRPSNKTIIRAYSNAEKCQLYIDGKKYGEPITDTNASDSVVDGFHVFMWYDVPLTEGGSNTIEVRGIVENEEVCTSFDNNGEVVFTAADMAKLILNITDSTKLELVGNTVNLIGGSSNGATIDNILDGTLASAPEGSQIKVFGSDMKEVTTGALEVGMTIRVLDELGNYQDYNVVAEASNIAQYKNATASSTEKSSNSASMAVDGILLNDASNSWKAKNKTAGEWIMIDLGAEYNMNKLITYFENKDSRVYPYEAQISSDGVNFTTVVDRSTNTDSAKTEDALNQNTKGRYLRLLFGVCNYGGSARIATVREIELYGWRFVNNGGYVIDEENKVIYLGETDEEHDTYEVESKLKIDGQADYEITTATGRVISNGDKLVVTEKYGTEIEYILNVGNKEVQ